MKPASRLAQPPDLLAQQHRNPQDHQDNAPFAIPVSYPRANAPPRSTTTATTTTPFYFDPRPLAYRGRYSEPWAGRSVLYKFVRSTGKLALFHLMNAFLGYTAFCVCLAGLAGSIGLLPLCCFGVVIFRVLLFAVYGFAQLDVMLYNSIAPVDQHVYVQVPQNPRTAALSGRRLSPTLTTFSPISMAALAYFLTVKFALGVLSTICFWAAITAPISLISSALGSGDNTFLQISFGPDDIAEFKANPVLFVLLSLSLFVIGVAFMHLVARASQKATRFFCCERFSTYRYIHQQYDASVPYYPVAINAYGSVAHDAPSHRQHYSDSSYSNTSHNRV
ncbi:hypothetical protein Poli38472_002832 [Pythium oligandrum]|uniref:Sensor domain-containing protein n=1 Tax=Pythium oligandrum TaxID=41045 RepID=A0A8K1C6F5_PYTOL|nr:hypothetical protein Poli38472_002832 [Pythium oligandrum]|eukprot:TMW56907.1 hypothetical protein Poli38472_002832 [Pythium oligandrum]